MAAHTSEEGWWRGLVAAAVVVVVVEEEEDEDEEQNGEQDGEEGQQGQESGLHWSLLLRSNRDNARALKSQCTGCSWPGGSGRDEPSDVKTGEAANRRRP
ncbi:hypothetical protein Q7P37_000876 [Cladosporium fusiforme]